LALAGEVRNRAGRLYVAVAVCAIVPHVLALWNGFAMDDIYIIVWNPLVHAIGGVARAFAAPYWPPDFGGQMYRPLPLATYAIDWAIAGARPAWAHAWNLLWHAGVTIAVTALTLHTTYHAPRTTDRTPHPHHAPRTALVAGLIFAVHPVHVEAIANVIGRAELLAALGVCLAVYAALVKDSIAWSALAFVAGLMSKENAVVAPVLIGWAWLVGIRRPPRARMLAYAGTWVAVLVVYVAVRAAVLHPYARLNVVAPVFFGESFVAGRLTAVAALWDALRLLIAPVTLRVDYSPAERTIVHSVLDGRFALGVACFALWIVLLVAAWRRGRRVEAFGLGWIAIAFLPVANLLFSTGVLIADRTLYLPSVGLALALGAALARFSPVRARLIVGLLVVAGAIRSAFRVPVWRDDVTITMSMLEDSPRSYRGHARLAAIYQSHRQPERALAELRTAMHTYDRDPTLFIAGADAAFTLQQPRLADSMLARAEALCFRCAGSYRSQARAARSRGDDAVADSLLGRAR
jgi:hypothetical protein